MKPASASWVAEPGARRAPPAADGYPISARVKLATGIAASGLLTLAAYAWQAQALFARLGTPVAAAMLKHGVTDGSVGWTTGAGWTFRRARLSGSADAATRAAILADVRAIPGIHDASWQERR
jgi:hypothetical protein